MSNHTPLICGVLPMSNAVWLTFRMIMSNQTRWSWVQASIQDNGAH